MCGKDFFETSIGQAYIFKATVVSVAIGRPVLHITLHYHRSDSTMIACPCTNVGKEGTKENLCIVLMCIESPC